MTADQSAEQHRPVTGPVRREPAEAGWRRLARYDRGWLRGDLVAGLTVGAMLVPQSMAYAELAGAPAITGLYAVVLAPVAYALLGSSRHLGTGPEPGTAILAGTGVAAVAGAGASPERALALLAALALMVAAASALAASLRLGFVATLLSRPVLVGYISGVGIVLLGSQLGAATGVPIGSSSLVGRVGDLVGGLGDLRGPTVTLFAGSLVIVLVARRFAPRVPGALVAVAAATSVSSVLDLPEGGEATVGAIPAGLPALGLPDVSAADVGALLVVALGIMIVGYSDNMLTARSIADRAGYRIDPNSEFAGLAAANLAAGLTQGLPVSSSASRTAVASASGGHSGLVGILASGAVAATLLFAQSLLGAIPRAALAAVIVAAAIVIVDVAGFRELWRVSRIEFLLAVTTALAVIGFDVLVGVLLAVALSVVVALGRMARPEDAVLGGRDDLDGWVSMDHDPTARTLPGLLVYRFDAPLIFVNVERFRSRVMTLLEQNPGAEEWVVLDFEGIGEIDTSAAAGLEDLLTDLAAEGVGTVALARANTNTLRRLARAGLVEPEGPIRSYPTINAAVAAFERR